MAREEAAALFVVGLLLVLAHSCAAQDYRTVGVGGGILPSSYLNSYGSTSSGGYNRVYSPYSYSDPSSDYGYYSNYQPGGYARQVPNVNEPVPGCDSGLLNYEKLPAGSGQTSSQMHQASRSETEQHGDGQTTGSKHMSSDPKASQTIATQTSNLQQSVVQQTPYSLHRAPITPIYGSSLQYPYGLRAAENSVAPSSNANNLRVVPSELYFVDPSQLAGRQAITIQGKPETLLTYDPQDMVHAYGAGNYQPPIFGLYSKRQNPASYRGLQSGYQYAYPPIDTRYLGAAAQQVQPQRRIEHPLPVLRQSSPTDHTNQPLPPNLYGPKKWEPVTNLNIQPPVNVVQYDSAPYAMQVPAGYHMQVERAGSSLPLCRDKRQTDLSWMYPYAGWPSYETRIGQQRAAAPPALPGLPSPINPYHAASAPLSDVFPTEQLLTPPGQNYMPDFANPHAKGAVEGIHHFVSGIAQMVPMFTGGTPFYR